MRLIGITVKTGFTVSGFSIGGSQFQIIHRFGIEEGFIGYDPRSGDAWEKAETVSRCIFITAVISETDLTDISFVKTVSQFAIDSLTRISGIVTMYK